MILLITFISALANLFLGVLVFRKDKTSPVARRFLLFTTAASAWIATNFFWLLTHRIISLEATYAAGIVFGLMGLIWTCSLCKRRLPIYSGALSVIGSALAVLSFKDDFMVKKPSAVFSSGFQTETGPAFIVYAIWMVLTLLITLSILFRGYRKAHGLRRAQIKYVFFGAAIFVFFVIVFDFFLPAFFNYFTLALMDAPSSIFLIGMTAYATLRYRLMEIQVILRKSFTYVMIGLFSYAAFHIVAWTFLSVFGSLWTFPSLLAGFIISVLFAIMLPRAERAVIHLANTYLYANFYSAEEAFAKLTDTFARVVELEKLATLIVSTIGKTLTVKTVGVAVSAPRSFSLVYSNGLDVLEKRAVGELLPAIKNISQVIVAHDLGRLAETNAGAESFSKTVQLFFQTSHTKVIIPLRSTRRLVGVIVLGGKRAGRGFTSEDIRLLDTMRKQAAIAIENALLYETLKESNESLKNLLTLREEFLDIVSHQLRTPISIIRGASKLLLNKDPILDGKETTELIYDASVRLNGLVDSMLLASRVGSADFALDRSLVKPVPLAELVREITNSLAFRIKQKHITLRVNISPTLSVVGYDSYLTVAFSNLIENAITYISQERAGEIDIFAEAKGAVVRLSIQDNGIGVPEKEKPKLFQKFARATNAMRAVPNGTGLGLFIIKKIIAAHPGGRYGFESDEGKGSLFWVELNAEVA